MNHPREEVIRPWLDGVRMNGKAFAEDYHPDDTCRGLLAAGKQAGRQGNLAAVVLDVPDGAQP